MSGPMGSAPDLVRAGFEIGRISNTRIGHHSEEGQQWDWQIGFVSGASIDRIRGAATRGWIDIGGGGLVGSGPCRSSKRG
jgi:hypothetical protein